jgi:hypothetical protein
MDSTFVSCVLGATTDPPRCGMVERDGVNRPSAQQLLAAATRAGVAR